MKGQVRCMPPASSVPSEQKLFNLTSLLAHTQKPTEQTCGHCYKTSPCGGLPSASGHYDKTTTPSSLQTMRGSISIVHRLLLDNAYRQLVACRPIEYNALKSHFTSAAIV